MAKLTDPEHSFFEALAGRADKKDDPASKMANSLREPLLAEEDAINNNESEPLQDYEKARLDEVKKQLIKDGIFKAPVESSPSLLARWFDLFKVYFSSPAFSGAFALSALALVVSTIFIQRNLPTEPQFDHVAENTKAPDLTKKAAQERDVNTRIQTENARSSTVNIDKTLTAENSWPKENTLDRNPDLSEYTVSNKYKTSKKNNTDNALDLKVDNKSEQGKLTDDMLGNMLATGSISVESNSPGTLSTKIRKRLTNVGATITEHKISNDEIKLRVFIPIRTKLAPINRELKQLFPTEPISITEEQSFYISIKKPVTHTKDNDLLLDENKLELLFD